MGREKITVENYVSTQAESFSRSLVNINLEIYIEREFEEPFVKDLSFLLKGLNKAEARSRRLELVQFVNFISKMKGSGTSKVTRFKNFQTLVKFANDNYPSFPLSSKETISGLHAHYQAKRNNKQNELSTVIGRRKQYRIILRDCYSVQEKLFNKWFPKFTTRTGRIKGARINDVKGNSKSFTRNDLTTLISMMLHYGRDFKARFDRGDSLDHLRRNEPCFEYPKGIHVIHTSQILLDETKFNVNEYMINRSTVYYMLVFIAITGMNLSPVMRAKRKDVALVKGERDLLTVLVTDKRKQKNKKPKPYLMKKHQEKLFNEVLEHSRQVDPNEDALLFPRYVGPTNFQTFSSRFVDSVIQSYSRSGPIGEYGETLVPRPKKLRDSHGQLFDDLVTRASVLGNSIGVAAKHYSDGNPEENTDVLQTGMNAYTLSLISQHELSTIQNKYTPDVDITLVDSEQGKQFLQQKSATKTSTGGICQNAKTSAEAELHTRKLLRLGLLEEDELICNNILACFTCPNHIFVNDESYVYLLLSFYYFLCESLYSKECGGLFGSRDLIDKTINEIDWMVSHRIDPNVSKLARRKIKYEGLHPLWSLDFMEEY